jgi:HPt (histidine-containing phosphotransfer) domain-containing protein
MTGFNTNQFIFNENLNVTFLEELFDGDTHYAETVFGEFLKDIPGYWSSVETAYIENNLTELKASVHKCKTLFGYVGATGLQELCQEFENKYHASATIALLESDYRVLLSEKEKTAQLIKGELNRLKAFNNRNC